MIEQTFIKIIMKKHIFSLFTCILITNSYAQLTDVFWERRNIKDTLSFETTNGIGEYSKVNVTLFRIDLKHFFIASFESSQDSEDAMFDFVYEVELDSAKNISNMQTFLSLSFRYKKDLFDLYMKGVITDEYKQFYLHDQARESGRNNVMYNSQKKDTVDYDKFDFYGIEKSLYETKVQLPVHFYKYNYRIPVANSDSFLPERTTMYGKIVFRFKEEIYTVYFPLDE